MTAQKLFLALQSSFYRHPWVLPALIILALFPALFINLGYLPLDLPTDECRRALVALEMIHSGNYLAPTLNGELYFNKPPLYNWIIAAFFLAFGDFSEWTLRLPVVLSLLGYGCTVFYFNRMFLSNIQAFISAMLFITSGRMFFYDSFLGLIDTTFSWLIYTNFMLVWVLFRKERYLTLFVVSYLITAITFMMKGLPSLVFQVLTLLTLFISGNKFWKLVSWQHIAGIGLLAVLLGCYYYQYYLAYPEMMETVFLTLLRESTKRMVAEFGIWKTIGYFLYFPFRMLYHFAPWTLMVLFLFRKEVWKICWNNPFIRYIFLVFLVNILVYWTSPEVYPRYLHMFTPLIFTVYAYVFFQTDLSDWRHRVFENILLVLCIGVTASALVFPWLPVTSQIPGVWPKSFFLLATCGFITVAYYYMRPYRLQWFLLLLVVGRIGFDWFVLPPREKRRLPFVEDAIRVGKATKGHPLYVYQDTPVFDGTTFYIARERGEVLKFHRGVVDSESYYLVTSGHLEGRDYDLHDQIMILFYDKPVYLVKFKP